MQRFWVDESTVSVHRAHIHCRRGTPMTRHSTTCSVPCRQGPAVGREGPKGPTAWTAGRPPDSWLATSLHGWRAPAHFCRLTGCQQRTGECIVREGPVARSSRRTTPFFFSVCSQLRRSICVGDCTHVYIDTTAVVLVATGDELRSSWGYAAIRPFGHPPVVAAVPSPNKDSRDSRDNSHPRTPPL